MWARNPRLYSNRRIGHVGSVGLNWRKRRGAACLGVRCGRHCIVHAKPRNGVLDRCIKTTTMACVTTVDPSCAELVRKLSCSTGLRHRLSLDATPDGATQYLHELGPKVFRNNYLSRC